MAERPVDHIDLWNVTTGVSNDLLRIQKMREELERIEAHCRELLAFVSREMVLRPGPSERTDG